MRSGVRALCSSLIAATLLAGGFPGDLAGAPETTACAADRAARVAAYEAPTWTTPSTPLDGYVLAAQRRAGVEPAGPCTDAVFLRRAYIDVIGTLPEPSEVRAFLADKRANRRALLVDQLLEREEFADYWSLKWCDVLRVKAEFPINLWPNAVQAYHHWVRDQIRVNRPYDRFVRDLLTSSGSNFREPEVNFWRAVQGRDPATLASAVTLTFMGARFEPWPEVRRAGMATFFQRVAYKKTTEWKEEIVLCDPTPCGPVDAIFPDGTPVVVPPDTDPRTVFADWLIQKRNPWFARAQVNRVWAWIFGRGLVDPADDLRDDNPAALPEAMAYLERAFADAHWDVKELIRLIVNSRTYQQSPVPRGDPKEAAAVFACYPVRRLDAEVLLDALCWIGGTGEGYTSTVPEPWTWVPEDRRTITLSDGTITSPFLEMFGRPARDTGLESERDLAPSGAQLLHLLNSTDVQRKIERSARLRAVYESARGNAQEAVRGLWLTLLSREPTADETTTALAYVRDPSHNARESAADLAWALVNSKEFLHRH